MFGPNPTDLLSPGLPLGVDDDHWLVTLAGHTLEGPQLDISLHDGIRKLAANQALGIKNLMAEDDTSKMRGEKVQVNLSVKKQ